MSDASRLLDYSWPSWPWERSKSKRRRLCTCSITDWLRTTICQLEVSMMQTGSYGQENIYVHSSWPLAGRHKLLKVVLFTWLPPGLGTGNLLWTWRWVWPGMKSFFFYCMFQLIISIKLPNSLIPIKTFQLVPALEKGSCLKTQPEICKQEWQGTPRVPDITMATLWTGSPKSIHNLFPLVSLL